MDEFDFLEENEEMSEVNKWLYFFYRTQPHGLNSWWLLIVGCFYVAFVMVKFCVILPKKVAEGLFKVLSRCSLNKILKKRKS